MLSVVGILNEISLDRLITALCVGSTKLALLFHDPSDVLITLGCATPCTIFMVVVPFTARIFSRA